MMGVGNNGVVAEARDVQLDEISNKILGDYKKAAGADASAADARGDVERGNKRFRGIVKATIKQGENDAKRHKQQGMAEAKWNPYDQGDFPINYNANDSDEVDDTGKAEKWQAMQSYYGSRANIVAALQAQRGLMHPAHGTKHGVQAVMSTSLGKRVVKTFPNKEKAYDYAGVHNYEVVEIKDTGLATNPITLNVILGHGEHKKQMSLQFPDMGKAQQWADRYHAEILGQGVAEGIDIGKEWMSDTELDQYVPDHLQQKWRELLGYDMNGNPGALWVNLTGGYEPDVRDPQHRALMVKVANKWFAVKKIPNVKFYDVKDADDELEWLVQIGQQGVAEAIKLDTLRSAVGGTNKDDVSAKLKKLMPKKSQSYNDPDWTKKLSKDKLDALAGKKYTKGKPVKESLGRATPKMPKPRDPGHAVLAAKRSSGAGGQHTNKKRQAVLQPKHQKPLTRDMDLGEDISRRGFLRGAGAVAAGAAMGSMAQASEYKPNMVAHITFAVNGNKISKDYYLGSKYGSTREAADAVTELLRSKGIKYFYLDIERVSDEQAADDFMDKTPSTDQGMRSGMDAQPYRAKAPDSKADYMAREDLDESIERHLMQMRRAGYNIK